MNRVEYNRQGSSENGNSQILQKEALQMADAVCKFIKELSELMIDKDVQYALRQLKFMGQQMLADPTTIQQFNSELSRHYQSEKAHIESGGCCDHFKCRFICETFGFL